MILKVAIAAVKLATVCSLLERAFFNMLTTDYGVDVVKFLKGVVGIILRFFIAVIKNLVG